MTFTRREALGLGAGAAVFLAAGLKLDPAMATAEDSMKMVMDFTGVRQGALAVRA